MILCNIILRLLYTNIRRFVTEQHFETTSPTAGNNLAYTSLELFCIFDVVLLLWFFNISDPKQLRSMDPTQKGVMCISLVQRY